MSGASLLSALLGLSFVSDFIKRHAVHHESGEMWPHERAWLRWGTFSRGDLLADGQGGMAEERLRFVVVRVPGWYWEPEHRQDFGRRVMPAGWRHKVFVYMQPSRRFPNKWSDGWREHLVPID